MTRILRRKAVDHSNHWVTFVLEVEGSQRTGFVEFDALRRYKSAEGSYEDAFDKASELIARTAITIVEARDLGPGDKVHIDRDAIDWAENSS